MENRSCRKLIPDLMKHEKYVINYRNLKYLISLGVKVTKLHRVIQFEQPAWLKPKKKRTQNTGQEQKQ